jgi:hypothetical protein
MPGLRIYRVAPIDLNLDLTPVLAPCIPLSRTRHAQSYCNDPCRYLLIRLGPPATPTGLSYSAAGRLPHAFPTERP